MVFKTPENNHYSPPVNHGQDSEMINPLKWRNHDCRAHDNFDTIYKSVWEN